MKKPTVLTVLGAGYVGLTSAAVFAHAGFTVHIVEPNPERLKAIKSGKSFFYEHGIDELVSLAIENGTLRPTDSYTDCIPASDVVFSCVGTPDNPDGSSNLAYVFAAAEETAKHAKPGLIYAQKSTVPVGTGEKIMKLFADMDKDITYVSNPEFLREGTAVRDTLFFDRVVVGGDDRNAVNTIMDIYMDVDSRREHIAHLARIPLGSRGGRYIATSLNSAELIKVTSNAFLALKISFANSIAMLSDRSGADIVEVMDGVGADHRIGRSFLNAGRGYGGGCFPKDVSGLISSGHELGVEMEIMCAAQKINQQMPVYAIDKLQETIGGSVKSKKIAVLGLAFKAGTSDVRKSPGIVMANLLKKRGASINVHDPEAMKEAVADLSDGITLCKTAKQAINDVDAIIVATDWPQYVDQPATFYAKSAKIFVDAMDRFSSEDIKAAGMHYIGIGRR